LSQADPTTFFTNSTLTHSWRCFHRKEARLLAEETLDELLNKYYTGGFPEAEAVQELVQIHGRGSDKAIRALVLHLHEYTQTLPDPAGWFERQLGMVSAADPGLWKDWLNEAIFGWRERWLPRLAQLPQENMVSRGCAQAVSAWFSAGPAPSNFGMSTSR
jgi:hypothetical protein